MLKQLVAGSSQLGTIWVLFSQIIALLPNAFLHPYLPLDILRAGPWWSKRSASHCETEKNVHKIDDDENRQLISQEIINFYFPWEMNYHGGWKGARGREMEQEKELNESIYRGKHESTWCKFSTTSRIPLQRNRRESTQGFNKLPLLDFQLKSVHFLLIKTSIK